MWKIIETSWNELWPIANILNEVCHGININDTENDVGFKYETIFDLLRKLSTYEVEEAKSDIKTTIELSSLETEIITKCFNEVFKQIEEWEFQTRIGITKKEANDILNKLTH